MHCQATCSAAHPNQQPSATTLSSLNANRAAHRTLLDDMYVCYCLQDLYKFCSIAFILQLSIFCLFIVSADKHHRGAEDTILRTVDVFIAAVPTGIPTVLVFSLGTRVRQLKHKKIDVLQVDKIKTAAATEVVCFDKTGTLTSTVVSLDCSMSGCDLKPFTSGVNG